MDKEKPKKFFIKKWWFWVAVFLNWIRHIVLAKQTHYIEYLGSLIGSFIFVFSIGMIIWLVVRTWRGIKEKREKKGL